VPVALRPEQEPQSTEHSRFPDERKTKREAGTPFHDLSVSRIGLAVILDVSFGCFGPVVCSVFMVAARHLSMVRRRLVFTRLVMSGGFLVVPRGVFVMLRGFMMMFCGSF
jgi:hypothetical protein